MAENPIKNQPAWNELQVQKGEHAHALPPNNPQSRFFFFLLEKVRLHCQDLFITLFHDSFHFF